MNRAIVPHSASVGEYRLCLQCAPNRGTYIGMQNPLRRTSPTIERLKAGTEAAAGTALFLGGAGVELTTIWNEATHYAQTVIYTALAGVEVPFHLESSESPMRIMTSIGVIALGLKVIEHHKTRFNHAELLELAHPHLSNKSA